MPVDPLNSHGLPPAGHGKVAGSRSAHRPESPAEEHRGEAALSSTDSVELSAASRELVDRADGGSVPAGTLSAARMHEVLRRLADGFYDGVEARTEVVRRARHDLGLSRPE